MKMYVPEIGDVIRLVSDWSFKLQDEYRNRSLWDALNLDEHPESKLLADTIKGYQAEIKDLERKLYPGNTYWRSSLMPPDPVDVARLHKLYDLSREQTVVTVKLPAGSVLSIDRIYIRKGSSDWSSLTFFLKDHPTMTFKKKPRFWVNLPDCNDIEFEQVTLDKA